MAASPPIISAWVIARRRNLDAGGRCVALTRSTEPILRELGRDSAGPPSVAQLRSYL